MNTRQILFSGIAIALQVPMFVHAAGLVPCGGTGEPECQTCHAIGLINSVSSWLVGVLSIAAAIMFVIAGFRIVTAQGNPSVLKAAKGMIVNVAIGFAIVLAAWLLIDLVMRTLLDDSSSQVGPWNTIACVDQPDAVTDEGQVVINIIDAYEDSDAADSIASGGAFALQYSTFDVDNDCRVQTSRSFSSISACVTAEASVPANSFVTSACDTSTYGTPPDWMVRPLCAAAVPDSVVADPTADGQFSYNSGIQAQRQHASPALEAVLSCMEQIVPGNVGRISSISHNTLVSGENTWDDCRTPPAPGQPRPCAHVANSRHFGGQAGSRGDMSWAVDFGDEENNTILCAAANQCGNIADCGVHNGNHTHISISY